MERSDSITLAGYGRETRVLTVWCRSRGRRRLPVGLRRRDHQAHDVTDPDGDLLPARLRHPAVLRPVVLRTRPFAPLARGELRRRPLLGAPDGELHGAALLDRRRRHDLLLAPADPRPRREPA